MSALAHDVDIGALVLQATGKRWKARDLHVEQRIVGGTIERTIVGASTLTIQLDDGDRTLLRSGLFEAQVDIELDGNAWRLVKVSKSADTLTLTFEDKVVALLRKYSTPRKAARSSMTRAEFALSLVREAKPAIEFVCPQLHIVQPIETKSDQQTDTQRTVSVSPGIANAANLTVKGATATREQKENGQRVLDVANSLKASERATLALMETAIIESTLHNYSAEQSDHPSASVYSAGILQVLNTTAAGAGIDARDIEACCNYFLTKGFTGRGGAIALAASHPSWTSGQVAAEVQGPREDLRSRYDTVKTEAAAWLAAYAYSAGAGTGGATTTQTVLTSAEAEKVPFQFQRGDTDGTPENTWDCLQRLADDVDWDCYVRGGAVYFVSESLLIRQRPIATLSEKILGVEGIDFDIDNGKTKSDVTLTVRASRWSFPPGACVVLEDCGPANGRWLVSDVQRGLFASLATVTLKRATKPLPEPLDDGTSVTDAGALAATSQYTAPSDLSGAAAKAYAAALAMDAKQYPYVWGGGHGKCGTPDHGVSGHRDSHGTIVVESVGYDCSGSSCAILGAADMQYKTGGGVDGSGTMAARFGEPGEGKNLTVWANAVHVWLEFKTSKGDQHFGTGEWGIDNPSGGPRFQKNMHTKDGFTPRHFKGT